MFSNRKDSGKFLNEFLSKKHRELIGWGLIIFGFALATPPFVPTPDDFLNIILATEIAKYGLPVGVSLVLTYTLVPTLLILAGIFVFPTRDSTIAMRVKKMVKKALYGYLRKLKDPKWIIASAITFYIVYNLYISVLQNSGLL